VLCAHRGCDADRRGLVTAASVERSWDLALTVEDVPALLDAARHEHVAVDAEEILAVEARVSDLAQRGDRFCFSRNRHGCSRTLTIQAGVPGVRGTDFPQLGAGFLVAQGAVDAGFVEG